MANNRALASWGEPTVPMEGPCSSTAVHGTFAQGVGLAFYMVEEVKGLAAEGDLEKGLDNLS